MTARVEGNQTTQFEYDYDNRLVKITYSDGSVVQFGYDGLGRRVWRQDSMGTRNFYYDGDRIIAEREGNTWVVRYLLGISPVGFVSGGTLKVYHADRLGSVRWVTDANQNMLVSYVYEGFGKIVGQNGGGGGAYQWCGLWGYRNDWDAGLMHIGARYYEFETGRWVQKDPLLGDIFDSQTLNLYLYVCNNPPNQIDPNGEQRRDPWPPLGRYIAFLISALIAAYKLAHRLRNRMHPRIILLEYPGDICKDFPHNEWFFYKGFWFYQSEGHIWYWDDQKKRAVDLGLEMDFGVHN